MNKQFQSDLFILDYIFMGLLGYHGPFRDARYPNEEKLAGVLYASRGQPADGS